MSKKDPTGGPVGNLDYLELVREASRRTFLPEETVRMVLEGLLEVMGEALIERKRVILREFGTLRIQLRSNPKIGDHVVTVFRTSNALQEKLTKELIHG
jgi:nucleoid DNA-binding protein